MFQTSKTLVALALSSFIGFASIAEETWPEGTQFVLRVEKSATKPSDTHYQIFFKEPSMERFEAMTADEAKVFPTLLGYTPKQFIRVDAGTAGSPLANRELSLENVKEFWALLGGTSTTYLKASGNGAQIPTVKGVPGSLTPGQMWFDSESKSIRFYNGSDVREFSTPVTGVRSITAGAGLTGGTITTVGTIALENFGTPGTYYKVTTDIKGRVKTGWTSLEEADIPTLTTAGKVSGSAINTGEIGGNTSIKTSGDITTSRTVSAGSVTAATLSGKNLAVNQASVTNLNSNTIVSTVLTATSVTSTNLSTSNLRIYDSSNSHQVGLNVASNSANYSLTLPTALPSSSGQVLGADTNGQLSWVTPSAPGTNLTVEGILPVTVTAAGSTRTINVIAATTQSSGVVTLAAPGGTNPNTVVQANDPRLVDARPPGGTAFGDLTGAYPAPFVAGLRGIAISEAKPADGQVLKFILADNKWTAGSIGLMDLRSNAGLTQIPTNCTAAQSMQYSSVTDQLICASIAISHTAVSGLGDAATKNVGTAAGNVAAADDARFGNALKLQGRDIATAAPVNAQVLTWNEGAQAWEPKALPEGQQGTLTSITAGHGLTGGTITTSGTIGVNAGTAAGQIVELDSSARLPSVDGSQLTNVNAVKIQGRNVAGAVPGAGEILKFNGAQWSPAKINLSDLRSTSGSALFPAPNCSASQTLSWSPALDQFVCQSIALNEGSLNWSSQTANTFFAAPNGSNGAPSFRQIAAADLPAGAYDNSYFKNGGNSFGTDAILGTNDNAAFGIKTAGQVHVAVTAGGQVGINTTAPQAALDVNGAVKVGNDDDCTSEKAGSIRWNGTSFQGCDGSNWNNLAGAPPAVNTPAAYAYQANTAYAVHPGTIPWNDTIPNNSQGTEVLTATITPSAANSLIEVSALIHFSQPFNRSRFFTVAAFQDSATSAFATSATSMTGVSCSGASDVPYLCQATLTSVFVANRTTPITIRIRAGGDTGTWEINGSTGRKLGGSLQSTLILKEIKR